VVVRRPLRTSFPCGSPVRHLLLLLLVLLAELRLFFAALLNLFLSVIIISPTCCLLLPRLRGLCIRRRFFEVCFTFSLFKLHEFVHIII
jgi:hypothetical protein